MRRRHRCRRAPQALRSPTGSSTESPNPWSSRPNLWGWGPNPSTLGLLEAISGVLDPWSSRNLEFWSSRPLEFSTSSSAGQGPAPSTQWTQRQQVLHGERRLLCRMGPTHLNQAHRCSSFMGELRYSYVDTCIALQCTIGAGVAVNYYWGGCCIALRYYWGGCCVALHLRGIPPPPFRLRLGRILRFAGGRVASTRSGSSIHASWI